MDRRMIVRVAGVAAVPAAIGLMIGVTRVTASLEHPSAASHTAVNTPSPTPPPMPVQFSFTGFPPPSDPANGAFANMAVTGVATCVGTTWQGASTPPVHPDPTSGIPNPYAMVVTQAPGQCATPTAPGMARNRINSSPVGNYVIHLDDCQGTDAKDITISVDDAYHLHLVSERNGDRGLAAHYCS